MNLKIDNEKLTLDFFTYLKWRKTKLDWRQMTCPADVFDGIPIISKSRGLKTVLDKRYSEINEKERIEIIKNIIKELEDEMEDHNLKRIFFYNLSISKIYRSKYMIILRYAVTAREPWQDYDENQEIKLRI